MPLGGFIKKLDYFEICKNRGFVYLTELKKLVYLVDEFGCIHKTNKERLNASWLPNLQSVIKEDKNKYFVKLACLRHSDLLNKVSFENFDYHLATSYTSVTCLIHGEYKTKPNWILSNGHHCRKCGYISSAMNNTKELSHFLEKSKAVHGERYNYDKVVYTGVKNLVKIVCKKHGDFEIVAGYHTQGNGCRVCGLECAGYSKSRYEESCKNGSHVYVFLMKKHREIFIKIGISKDIPNRMNLVRREGGYEVNLLYKEFFEDAGVAWDVESMLHKEFKQNSYTPSNKFGGSTECFDISIKDEAIKLLKCVA